MSDSFTNYNYIEKTKINGYLLKKLMPTNAR